VKRARELAAKHGPRFEPASIVVRLAQSNALRRLAGKIARAAPDGADAGLSSLKPPRRVWVQSEGPLTLLEVVMFDRTVARAMSVAAPLLLLVSGAEVQAQGTAAADPGRDLYAAHCSRCHGSDAAGTADGPNLLRRVKGMSEDAFGAAVLQRYRFSVPAGEAGGESAAREAMLRGVLTQRDGSGEMPAWQSQPAVAGGIRSLYAFLSAKAR